MPLEQLLDERLSTRPLARSQIDDFVIAWIH